MPLQRCFINGKHGYKCGEGGKCYTYSLNDKESMERAKEDALEQGRAIEANKCEHDDDKEVKSDE